MTCRNGCEKPIKVKGLQLCGACYQRHRRASLPECSVEGCSELQECRKDRLCDMHLWRFRKYGDPLKITHGTRRCEIPGCDEKHYARGHCRTHYTRWRVNEPEPFNPAERRPPLDATPLVAYARTCGLNAMTLAQQLRISHRYIYDLMNGQRATIRRDAADRYCIALGIHPAILWPKEWVDAS